MRSCGWLCILLATVWLPGCPQNHASPTAAPRSATTAEAARLNNDANVALIRLLPPPPGGEFSFIVLGDNRSGDAAFNRVIAQINSYVHEQQGPARPLFVLHTGDIVPSGLSREWNNYARLRAELALSVVHVRGNHEIVKPEGPGNYERLVGGLEWSFDFGGCRFIGLDNATGRFSAEGISFLQEQLSPTANPLAPFPVHKFVLFHEPPAVGRWKIHAMKSDKDGGRGGEVLAAVEAAKVDAVFLGHIHLFDAMELGGVPFIISGGAGSPLHKHYGFGTVQHGFVVVQVALNGFNWEWIPLEQ